MWARPAVKIRNGLDQLGAFGTDTGQLQLDFYLHTHKVKKCHNFFHYRESRNDNFGAETLCISTLSNLIVK
ncbi:hypothetical protein L596_021980 [Steinernema carpocapsae]|uniref:Uncharacterized protein n=1 Tax=Steinernema carpocapsae TaxID=34508 RepID=A0A4U5MKE2_STECR|nr:hypothetical protein L596_021980 [Steinernema carpocapsae]